jgi:hypothetical protein
MLRKPPKIINRQIGENLPNLVTMGSAEVIGYLCENIDPNLANSIFCHGQYKTVFVVASSPKI